MDIIRAFDHFGAQGCAGISRMTASMSRARSATALVLTVAAFVWTVGALAQESLFPRPAELEPAVQFWTRVYTEVDTHSGFIHDDLRLDIVYETIKVAEDLSPRERKRHIEHASDTYGAILNKLCSGARARLSDEEQPVLAWFPAGP